MASWTAPRCTPLTPIVSFTLMMARRIATNHLARRYGLSWAPDPKVARRLATRHGAGEGAAVVLRADVPADAIIADLREHWHARHIGEPQLLVDPRMLGEIEVIETVPWPPQEGLENPQKASCT
jgi:hypothetical protein